MQRVRLTTLAAVAALTLAGCGESSTDSSSSGSDTTTAVTTAETIAAGTTVSANDATEAELLTIPGVGEKIADEIMEYRPYDATTGEAKFRKELAKYISAEEIDALVPYLDFS